jgi:ABC-type glycerol-3-phosphate transport system substrate-binding protein
MRQTIKKAFLIFIFSILLLPLSSCKGKSTKIDEQGPAESTSALSEDLSNFLVDIDWEAMDAADWRDNTLDAYEATTIRDIAFQTLKDTMCSGELSDDYMITAGGARHFCKRYDKNPAEGPSAEFQYDALLRIARDGSVKEGIVNIDSLPEGTRIQCFGMTSGSARLWAVYKDPSNDEARLFREFSEEGSIGQEGKTVSIPFLIPNGENILNFMIDQKGRIYLMTYRFSKRGDAYYADPDYYFYVASPEGEKLFETSFLQEPNDSVAPSLVQLPDGEVGISYFASDKAGRRFTLATYEEETKDLKVLGALEPTFRQNYSLTLSASGELLSVHSAGVTLTNPQTMEEKQLYEWKNHGMRVQGASFVTNAYGDAIDLFYRDGQGLHYLSLKPVTEQRPIVNMVLAANSSNADSLQVAANQFNQKYPSYHLEIEKKGYENQRFLSELIAGEGPVLIDTNLTGFATQQKLWEPLGGALEAMGLTSELEPLALECGKIDGETYGIVTNFHIETILTIDPATKGWNYEAFLEYLQTHQDCKWIYNDYDSNDGALFVNRFWQHGLNDGYLFDGEKRESYIDTDRFRAILKLASEKCQSVNGEDSQTPYEKLRSGEELFNLTTFLKPNDFSLCRILYGDDVIFAGEPMENGSAHMINSDCVLAVRKNASLEEKKGALLFFRELLSYENQLEASKELNFKFSVRKDVLRENFMSLTEDAYASSGKFGMITGIQLGDKADPEKDYQKFQEVLSESIPVIYNPRELTNIFWEELEPYFDGTVDAERMIKQLDSRVTLYLQEQ